MKFSAEDIANQKFQKSFRGLDGHQVQEFLSGLAREWELLTGELKRLQGEVDAQSKDLRDYRRRERSLVEALEMAKQVADEIRLQADRDADLVIAQTELKAEKILAQAEKRVASLLGELQDLQQQRIRFETQMRHLLDGHARMLEAVGDPSSMETFPPPPPMGAPEYDDIDDADIEDAECIEAGGVLTDEIRRRPTTLTGFQGEAGAQ